MNPSNPKPSLNRKERKALIENDIYAAIIGECERLEHENIYRGNGHHLAQRLTHLVSVGILSKQKKKIYKALTAVPTPTKEIAQAVGIPSKNVSAQLKQMSKTTLLIQSKRNGRLVSWYI